MELKNFLKNYPFSKNELIEDILVNRNFKIERIISRGQITPENDWYDQMTNEWVMLLKGSAILLFENEEELKIEPGDYLNIPAHTKHKVIFTDTEQESIWITIHY